jgi:hypothetical protein
MKNWRPFLLYISAMSLADIESELKKLSPEELRQVALKSWSTFVEKGGDADAVNGCDEDDPQVLAALDEALQKADAAPGQGRSGQEVRARIAEWTTK